MKKYSYQKFIILFMLFLGYFAFSISFPVVPSMIIEDSVFKPYIYLSKNFLLGLSLGTYPLGQFIGSPIIGKLSDIYGRKNVLVTTLAITSINYMITTLAIYHGSFLGFIVMRFISGLFESNISLINAVMSDISVSSREKMQNFGEITTYSSVGCILGPILGGILCNKNISRFFACHTPFMVIGVIFGFSSLIAIIAFKETNITLGPVRHPRWDLWPLNQIYVGNFFFYLSVCSWFLYLPLILMHKYSFGPTTIGAIQAYSSLLVGLSPIVCFKYLPSISYKSVSLISSIGISMTICIIIILKNPFTLVLSVALPSYFIGIGYGTSSFFVSSVVGEDAQGSALGINQSLMFAGEFLMSIFGGSISQINVYLPIIAGLTCASVASLLRVNIPERATK